MINDKTQYKYHYFYKITNTVNNKFYYGVHSTNNLNDGYMGSGSNIKKAIKKYGINCFIKEIIKFFNTSEEKYLYEKQFVNKSLLQNPLCYNIMEGGYAFPDGWFKVKDKNGNISLTTKDDPKYLSGELKGINTGKVCVQDNNNNKFLVSKDDPRYLSGELKSIAKNKINVFDIIIKKHVQIDITEFHNNRSKYIVFSENKIVVKDDDNNILHVSKDDPRYLSGELKSIIYNTVVVKDNNGNKFRVSKDDPRYLSGELKSIAYNTTIVKDDDNNILRVSKDDPRYLSGELKGVNNGYKTYLDKDGNIRRGNIELQTDLKFCTYINNQNNTIYTHSNDPRVLSGEYKPFLKNKIPVKDKNNNIIFVSKDDPRYLSGELKYMHKNEVTVKDKNGKCFNVSKDDPRYLSGELVRATTDTILMFDINGNKKMIPCSKFKDYYNLQWRPKYFYSYMNKTKKFLERDVPENYKFSTYNFKTRLYKLHKEYNIPLPQ